MKKNGMGELLALLMIKKGKIEILQSHIHLDNEFELLVESWNNGELDELHNRSLFLVPVQSSLSKLPKFIDCSVRTIYGDEKIDDSWTKDDRRGTQGARRTVSISEALAKRVRSVKVKLGDIPKIFMKREYSQRKGSNRKHWTTSVKELFHNHQIDVQPDDLKKLYEKYLKENT